MSDWIQVCSNTIENISVCLYANNNKKSYQRISMINCAGVRIQMDVISPADFYTVISTILYSTTLDDAIKGFNDTWASNILADMINNLKN